MEGGNVFDLDGWRQLAHDVAGLPLLFNAALSPQHAELLIERLEVPPAARVLDLGCGWGELLLRLLARYPDVVGLGLDCDAAPLARAQTAANDRGLDGRVEFVCADLLAYAGTPADVLLALGIGRAAPARRDILALVHTNVRPGGTVLFADGYWRRQPTPDELVATDRDLGSLEDLIAEVEQAEFDVTFVSESSEEELTLYSEVVRAGLRHASTQSRETNRSVIDAQERMWRDALLSLEGFAYLELRKSDPTVRSASRHEGVSL